MDLTNITPQTKILILGFAREGQSTYKFLRSKFPEIPLSLADIKTPDWVPSDPHVECFFGPDYLNCLSQFDLCIKSPGISPHQPEIVAAKKSGLKFSSHTRLFFEVCPSHNIIGISGTKGKSTTTSLTYEVLKANGLDAVLVGNIGRPALDFLPEISPHTWVVMELSSYQLQDLNISPHIAVMQNIFPDHLDYHKTFEEYIEAKSHLVRFQTPNDYVIFNSDFPLPTQIAHTSPGKKISYSLLDFDPQIKTKLIGNHNKLNIIPVVKISELLQLSQKITYSAIENFTPLDTRLQCVGNVNGIMFYEDTLATIPEATIAAIDALHPTVGTLIAGGHERKQNYSVLAKKILESGINTLIVFPVTGPRIWTEITTIKQNPNLTYHYSETMSDAVKFALDHTASGKIVLLSPAAPSFTLFKDYRDESQQYRQAINLLRQDSQS
jgi:UDP-N-acetylmuramoylalanine--D-glutamate ligase